MLKNNPRNQGVLTRGELGPDDSENVMKTESEDSRCWECFLASIGSRDGRAEIK